MDVLDQGDISFEICAQICVIVLRKIEDVALHTHL